MLCHIGNVGAQFESHVVKVCLVVPTSLENADRRVDYRKAAGERVGVTVPGMAGYVARHHNEVDDGSDDQIANPKPVPSAATLVPDEGKGWPSLARRHAGKRTQRLRDADRVVSGEYVTRTGQQGQGQLSPPGACAVTVRTHPGQ